MIFKIPKPNGVPTGPKRISAGAVPSNEILIAASCGSTPAA
jgi:hypothetical protein